MSLTVRGAVLIIIFVTLDAMRPYGVNPKHKPSPGPRQPKPLDDTDPAVQAERERVLAIIADMGHKAARGEYDHLDRRALLAVVYLRVKHG